MFDDLDAQRAFRVIRRPLCLFGHTHVPAIFSVDDDLQMHRTAARHALRI